MPEPAPLPNPDAPLGEKLLMVVATWVVPGLGYGLKRDWKLFAANFLLLELVFCVGLFALHAPVMIPAFETASEEFSIINIFVFIGQVFNGALALFSAYDFARGPNLLGAVPQHWQADLGTFYLLIGGAMNFFVVLGVWDRYYAHPAPPADAAQPRPHPAPPVDGPGEGPGAPGRTRRGSASRAGAR